MILATPAIRALRDAFPDAQIGVAGFSETLPVLEANPNIDRFHPYLKEWKDQRGGARLRSERQYIREVQEGGTIWRFIWGPECAAGFWRF
ncbi:MAG: hypothetical protein MPW14_04520 [Candidatus Manganitrophus sp.]|nr:MAG: hypothetical protein MPW14_04520 [Candidatus Manganitrophus sp.]